MNTRKHLKVLDGLWSNKVRVERRVVCILTDQQGLESTSVQVTVTLVSHIWVRVVRTCLGGLSFAGLKLSVLYVLPSAQSLISFKYITHFSLPDTDVKTRMRWILAFKMCNILYFVVVSCFLHANKVILWTVFALHVQQKDTFPFFWLH